MAGLTREKVAESGTSMAKARAAGARRMALEGSSGAGRAGFPPRWELREVMDIRQASAYLGISADSLYKYASEGLIPAFKLGNRWRFKRSLLEEWMERQSLPPLAPVPEKRVRAKLKKPAGRAR
jgi:excisionase family DNA binding protein